MLITITQPNEWTSLGLESDTTYCLQAKSPFNIVWTLSLSGSPESKKDGITACGSTVLKFKATGSEKVLVECSLDKNAIFYAEEVQ